MTHLLKAYRDTGYLVTLPAGPVASVRVGDPAPSLDRALADAASRSWAFVTAYNPGPRRLSRPINHRRNGVLARAARRRGLPLWPAVGLGHTGGPTEPGFALPGATPATAVALGRAFGQLAVLHGYAGRPVRLLPC